MKIKVSELKDCKKENKKDNEKVKGTYNPNCPCMKAECPRHGHCDECREYHKDSDKPRPCDR